MKYVDTRRSHDGIVFAVAGRCGTAAAGATSAGSREPHLRHNSDGSDDQQTSCGRVEAGGQVL